MVLWSNPTHVDDQFIHVLLHLIYNFQVYYYYFLFKVIHNLQELQDTDWCSPNKNWLWERVAGQRLSLSQVFHHHQHYRLSSHIHHQIVSWYGCHLVF